MKRVTTGAYIASGGVASNLIVSGGTDIVSSGGAATGALKKAVEIRAQAMANGKPVELKWSAAPENKGDSYAFLPQVVEMAQHDDGPRVVRLGLEGHDAGVEHQEGQDVTRCDQRGDGQVQTPSRRLLAVRRSSRAPMG